MSLWSRLLRWGRTPRNVQPPAAADAAPATAPGNTVELPAEPFVFECQSCGKVFEARRLHPACPECDSSEVSLVSE